jgi:hypothetical protein
VAIIGSARDLFESFRVLLVLPDTVGFGLEIEHTPHGVGVVLRQLQPLTGGRLLLQTVLAQSQAIQLVEHRIRKRIGCDSHNTGIE